MKKRFISTIVIVFLSVSLFIQGCGNRLEHSDNNVEEPIIIIDESNDFHEDDNNTISLSEENLNDIQDHDTETSDDDILSLDSDRDEFNDVLIEESEEESEEKPEDESMDESENVSETAQTDWVASLKIASSSNQLLMVSAKGSACTVSFHEKDSQGIWSEIFTAEGRLGKNGVGKTKEGDGKTPKGIYHFTMCFGRKDNPGCNLNYVKVNDSHYWVDDVNSAYYNQFVSTDSVAKDWKSAEHLAGAGESYNYALATDYNAECVKGAGSAIFVHCLPTGGAGCVAIPENKVKILVSHVKQGCNIIIDSTECIETY